MSRSLAAILLRKGFAKLSTTHVQGRRQFLRQSALATAALLTGCRSSQPVVSIIGGGLAGLSAAYELKKAGIPFTLYEASSRLGGRTFTIPDAVVEGAWVDFGAEYVDSNHEQLIRLAHELQVPLTDLRKDPLRHWTYFFEGEHRTEESVVDALQPYSQKIIRDIQSLPADLHYEAGAAFRRLDEMSITEYLNDLGMKGWLKALIEMAVTSEYAMEADEQSAINFLVMLSVPFRYAEDYHLFHAAHEVIKVKGGTGKLADALAAHVTDLIKTDHTLREIKRSANGYELSFTTPSVESNFHTDILLLAVPLPVLRNIRRDFRFPELKEQAIAETGFGNGSKVAMGFKSQPWRSQGFQGYTFNDLTKTLIWDSSQGANTSEGSLTFSGGGKISDEFQAMSYAKIKDRWLKDADRIYPGLQDAYNGSISKFCWAINPLAGGSYTSFRKGQWSRFAGVHGEPFENIHFAGEHCSIEFQGYMNGAIETGQQEASRIIEKLKH